MEAGDRCKIKVGDYVVVKHDIVERTIGEVGKVLRIDQPVKTVYLRLEFIDPGIRQYVNRNPDWKRAGFPADIENCKKVARDYE
jgi:signal peptidase I